MKKYKEIFDNISPTLSNTNFGAKLNYDKYEENIARLEAFPSDYILAKLAKLAYYDKIIIPPDLKDWEVLTCASSKSITDGYKGVAFFNSKMCHVVIAHRGTNGFSSAINDLFLALKVSELRQAHSAVSFAYIVAEKLKMINRSNNYGKPPFRLTITGHSLGAWLAQYTTFTVKYLTLNKEGTHFITDDNYLSNIHPHTVVFESPGCKEGLKKLVEKLVGRSPFRKYGNYNTLDMTVYLNEPNWINSMQEQIGTIYMLPIKSHSINYIIDYLAKDVIEKKVLLYMSDGSNPVLNIFRMILGTTTAILELKQAKEDRCSLNVFNELELEFIIDWYRIKNNSYDSTNIKPFLAEYNIPEFKLNFEYNLLKGKKELKGEDIKKVILIVKNLRLNFSEHLFQREIELFASKFCNFNGYYFNDIYGLLDFFKSDRKTLHVRVEYVEYVLAINIIRNVIYYTENDLESEFNLSNDKVVFLDWQKLSKFVQNSSNILNNYSLLVVEYDIVDENENIKFLKFLQNIKIKVIVLSINRITFNDPVNIMEVNAFGNMLALVNLRLESQEKLLNKKCFQLNNQQLCLNDLIKNVTDEIIKNSFPIISALELMLSDESNLIVLDSHFSKPLKSVLFYDLYRELQPNQLLHNLGDSTVFILHEDDTEVDLDTITKNIKNLVDIKSTQEYEQQCFKNIAQTQYLITIKKGKIYLTSIFNYNFYIHRSILVKKRSVNPNMFKNTSNLTDYYIFYGDKEQYENLVSQREDCLKFVFSEDEATRTAKKWAKNKLSTHVFKINEDGAIDWKMSYGSINFLNKHMLDKNVITTSKYEMINDDQIIIISGEPGIGKSSVIEHLYLILKSKYWIFPIQLKYCNFDGISDELTFHKVAQFLINNCLYGAKSIQHVLSLALEHGSKKLVLYILMDSFDEICNKENEIKIINIINFLKLNSNVKILITTRPHLTKQLENDISVFSSYFEPLNYETDIITFLPNFWISYLCLFKESVKEDYLKSVAGNILTRIEKTYEENCGPFIEIPMHLRLLAVTVTEDIHIESEVSNVLSLYHKYIKQRCDVYFRRYLLVAHPKLQKWLIESIFRKISSLSINQMLNIDIQDINNEEMEEFNKVGLVYFENNSKYKFFHDSIRDYFISHSIKQWLTSQTFVLFVEYDVATFLISDLFLNEELKKVRSFLNLHLKTILITSDRISSCKNKLVQICENNYSLLVNDYNESIFHICVKENLIYLLKYFLLKLLDSKNAKNILTKTNIGLETSLYYAINNTTEDDNPDRVVNCLTIFLNFLNNLEPITDVRDIFLATLFNYYSHENLEKLNKYIEKFPLLKAIMREINVKTPLIKKYLNACEANDLPTLTEILSEFANDTMMKTCLLNSSNENKETGIHLTSDIKIVEMLIEDSNINLQDHHGMTPLCRSIKKLQSDIAKRLIEKGASYVGDNSGFTPLIRSAKYNLKEIVKMVLNPKLGRKVDVNECNLFQITPLMIAAKHGNKEIVNYLIEKGADIHLRDCNGFTAFHHAVKGKCNNTMKLLKEKGSDINTRDKYGTTPLLHSVKHKNFSMIHSLLSYGADVNIGNVHEQYPLPFLIKNNLKNVCKKHDVYIKKFLSGKFTAPAKINMLSEEEKRYIQKFSNEKQDYFYEPQDMTERTDKSDLYLFKNAVKWFQEELLDFNGYYFKDIYGLSEFIKSEKTILHISVQFNCGVDYNIEANIIHNIITYYRKIKLDPSFNYSLDKIAFIDWHELYKFKSSILKNEYTLLVVEYYFKDQHQNAEMLEFLQNIGIKVIILSLQTNSFKDSKEVIGYGNKLRFNDLIAESQTKLLNRHIFQLNNQKVSLNDLVNNVINKNPNLMDSSLYSVFNRSASIDELNRAFVVELILADESNRIVLDCCYSKLLKSVLFYDLQDEIVNCNQLLYNSDEVMFFVYFNDDTKIDLSIVFSNVEYKQVQSNEDYEQQCFENVDKTNYLITIERGKIYITSIFNKKFYVRPSIVHKRRVNRGIFENSIDDLDHFIFYGDKGFFDRYLVFRQNDRFKFAISETEDIEIEKLSASNIHLFKINQNGTIDWKKSYGSIDSLHPYMENQKVFIAVSDIMNEDQIIIISEEPGIGKSSLIEHLCLTLQDKYWIFQIQLKHRRFDETYDELTYDNVAKFIINNCSCDPKLNRYYSILSLCLQYGSKIPICLMLDSFDESSNTSVVINIINFLKLKTNVKILITTRPHLTRQLENKFSVFASHIKPLHYETEMCDFLLNFWKCRFGPFKANIENILENMLENAKYIVEEALDNFIRIPMNMRVLAELITPHDECITLQIRDTLTLYNKYIDIYLAKFNTKSTPKSWLIQWILEKFGTISTLQLLDVNISDHVTDKELKEIHKTGLTYIDDNVKYWFLNKWVCDYFIADSLKQWLILNTYFFKYDIINFFVSDLFLKPELQIVRLFLNFHLETNPITLDSIELCKEEFLNVCKNNNYNSLFNAEKESIFHICINENLKFILKYFLFELLDSTNTKLMLTATNIRFETSLIYAIKKTSECDDQSYVENCLTIFLDFLNTLKLTDARDILLATYFCSLITKQDIDKLNSYIENYEYLKPVIDEMSIQIWLIEDYMYKYTSALSIQNTNKKTVSSPFGTHNTEISTNERLLAETMTSKTYLMSQFSDVQMFIRYINRRCDVYSKRFSLHSHPIVKQWLIESILEKITSLSIKELLNLDIQHFSDDTMKEFNKVCSDKSSSNYSLQEAVYDYFVTNAIKEWLTFPMSKPVITDGIGKFLISDLFLNKKLKNVRKFLDFHLQTIVINSTHIELCKEKFMQICEHEYSLLFNDKNESIFHICIAENLIYLLENFLLKFLDAIQVKKFLSETNTSLKTPLYYAIDKTIKDNHPVPVENCLTILLKFLDNLEPIADTRKIFLATLFNLFTSDKEFKELNKHITNFETLKALVNTIKVKIVLIRRYLNSCKQNNLKGVKIILEKLDNDEMLKYYLLKSTNNNKRTGIHLTSNIAIAEMLIKPFNINLQDEMGRTPLCHSIICGRVKIAKLLIKEKASYIGDNYGQTPLMQAVQYNLKEPLNIMLNSTTNNIDINECDAYGETLLIYAIRHGHKDIVNNLITNKNADIHISDNRGRTALWHAVKGRSDQHARIVEILISHGANINSCTTSGETPLHLSIEENSFPVIHKLINHGANINIKNIYDESPLQHLKRNKLQWQFQEKRRKMQLEKHRESKMEEQFDICIKMLEDAHRSTFKGCKEIGETWEHVSKELMLKSSELTGFLPKGIKNTLPHIQQNQNPKKRALTAI